VVHVHQACTTDDTLKSKSHRRGQKTITNTIIQEKTKLKRGAHKTMRTQKVPGIINLINQQTPNISKAKNKKQLT
jgi:hypothetical protein